MAAHGGVLVGEHTSEMVGNTCIRWGFFDYYYYFYVFDYHFFFDFDNGCDAVGDDNNCCAEQ